MITQPESNIKLTDTQNASIQEAQSRVLAAEAQVTVHNHSLKTLKLELERTSKDLMLQNDLFVNIQKQVEEAQAELATLSEQKYDLLTDLATAKLDLEEVTKATERKHAEVTDRESKVALKETDLVSRETSVSLREEDVTKSEKELSDKHAKLRDFVKNI